MISNKRTFRISAAVSLLLILLAGIGIARPHLFKAEKVETVKTKAVREDRQLEYQPELLEEFRQVSSLVDANREEYELSGKLIIGRKRDSVLRSEQMDYLFSKKGKDLYYRLGKTETFNQNGIYVYVDHHARKVLVSTQKDVAVNKSLIDSKQLLKTFRSEGYELIGSDQGNERTVKLLNNNHVSCREYAITYNKSDKKVTGILTRLTDLEGEINEGNEMSVDLRIGTSKAVSELQRYNKALPVEKQGEEWRLKEGYVGYELRIL